MKNKRKNWWMFLLRGLLFIAIAILIFRNPLASLAGLTMTIGFLMVITGAVFTVGSFTIRKFYSKWGWTLALGILDIILGVVLLFFPALTTPLVIIFIGCWVLGIGLLESGLSFGLKKFGFRNWWMLLLIGISSIVFGILILFNPLAGALTVSFIMGFQFLAYGFYQVVRSFQNEEEESSEPIVS